MPIRMAKIQPADNTPDAARAGAQEALFPYCWWECKMGQPF